VVLNVLELAFVLGGWRHCGDSNWVFSARSEREKVERSALLGIITLVILGVDIDGNYDGGPILGIYFEVELRKLRAALK
jgi:hypothetical protein